MNQKRRELLRIATVMGLAISAGIIKPTEALAADWNSSGFDAKSLADALKTIGAEGAAISADVAVNGPAIAENGAVVPVQVTSSLPGTEYMAILVEKNPNPLSAAFTLPAGTEAAISTRIKMGGTSNVHALVKANGKWFIASKEIKVTLGGCGG
ncbi:thiosulfate oxidation carrier protein SoxY [Massilia solisilvae]|uniref:Thiosulfate oxidation carrier protein SoxY n=1 Tax=Massilia solisilvae TaxID=1811225 RepID=A0ABT2BGL2_9BURK|nr:thiosulfate oxidation carrier protein SoxY [Massilia solisilvae]MCS0607654.1 thiosulfate oxidation carrier protein SoxY [Massilia solisilvae]